MGDDIDNFKEAALENLEIMNTAVRFNDDGTVLLEWSRREDSGNATILSLIIDRDSLVLSVMKDGDNIHSSVFSGMSS